MSKVRTFSRVFPAGHPRAGQATHFVEKILNSIDKHNYWFGECSNCGWMGSANVMGGGNPIADTGDFSDCYCPNCGSIDVDNEIDGLLSEPYYIGKFQPKGHTIRGGQHFKPGDKFSPRVWSGKPYASKQIIIAPDIEVKKTWDIYLCLKDSVLIIEDTQYVVGYEETIAKLAANDGLTVEDFKAWFKKPFEGQIICWDETINY